MPNKNVKPKTKRGATKRMKVTGTGNIKVRRAFRSHNTGKRSAKPKLHARSNKLLKQCDMIAAKQLVGLE